MDVRSKAIVALALAVALTAGCTRSYAPERWLGGPQDVLNDPYGAWIHVEYHFGGGLEATVAGELIAVTTDSLYVLVGHGHLMVIPNVEVRFAQAEAYRSGAGGASGYAVLGTLSTLSHGGYLILTAPLWIISGSVSAGALARDPVCKYPEESLAGFAEFARFPQGMPEGARRKGFAWRPEP